MNTTTDKYIPKEPFSYYYPIEVCSCPTIFRKAYKLTELDIILLNIIISYGEQGSEYEGLGLLLGFAVKKDWRNGLYEDPAEIEIYNNLLSNLIEFNLITIGSGKINPTEDGLVALVKNTKYKYYNTSVTCYQDQVPFKTPTDFSFVNEFGLSASIPLNGEHKLSEWVEKRSNIETNNLYWYDRVSTLYSNEEDIEILRVEEPTQFDLKKINVCYSIALTSSYQHHCGIVTNMGLSYILSQIINHQENSDFKNTLIFDYRFEKIWNDNEALFTIIEIEEFASKWNWDLLIQDKRLDWSIELLEFIYNNQSNGHWVKISELIPIDLLEEYFERFKNSWEWSIITERLSEDFINIHFEEYADYWNKTNLLKKEIEFVKNLIYRGIENDISWDLTELTGQFSDEFILETFNSSNRYDNNVLSNKNREWILTLVKREQNKLLEQIPILPFDWSELTDKWDLDFILENIDSLQSLVDWKVLLYRVISSSDYKWLLYDDGFKILLAENAHRTIGFSEENIIWTEDLLIRLDELELLIWSSTISRKGIDTNDSIIWTLPLFLKFNHRFSSKLGQNYISSYIDSFDYLRTLPEFAWDWYSISNNRKLIWTPDTLHEFRDKIFWGIISEKLPETFVDRYFEKFREYWDNEVLSSKASFQFISKYLDSFDWDFSILTKRDEVTVTSFIKDNRIPTAKWDWGWMSGNYSTENLKNILPFFALVNEFVDEKRIWEQLTRRLDWEYVISIFYNKWDWKYLTTEVPIENLILYLPKPISNYYDWVVLTKRLLNENLLEDIIAEGEDRLDWNFLIGKHYGLEYLLDNKTQTAQWINQIKDEKIKLNVKERFTQRLNLEQKRTLMDEDESLNILDWTHLSLLPSLQWTSYLIDKFKEKWDWIYGLSRNNKINWNWDYLQKYKDKWDWEYISEFSYFLKLDKNEGDDKKNLVKVLKTIEKFEKHINFVALSSRTNIYFTDELIKAHLPKWDFSILSENKSLRISSNLLIETQENPWNWQVLSLNRTLKLDNDTIIKLKDKNWDWFELTGRHEIEFNFDFINQTIDKPWNWEKIGNSLDDDKDFFSIIELIKDKGLNWSRISSKKFIDFSKCLEPLAKYWDFKVLSQNLAFHPNAEQVQKFSEKWDYKSLTQLRWNDNQGKMAYISNHTEKEWDWEFLLNDQEHPKSIEWMNLTAHHLDWNCGTEIFMKLGDKEIESGLEILKWHLNWNKIAKNYDFTKKHKNKIDTIYQKEPALIFLNRLENQASEWKGYIYHYAHLENVVKILNSGEILSRFLSVERGVGQNQSSKSVVYWKEKYKNIDDPAHEYARFYFRPKTPYQYYTEGLGIPFGKGIYEEYAQIGVEYPKCPVPFLIKIPLKEVLLKPPTELRITNGNFHKIDAQAFLIHDAVHIFDYENVYMQYDSNRVYEYKKASQQELVVKDKLDISTYENIKIVCLDNHSREILLNSLSQGLYEKWKSKIGSTNIHSHFNLNNSFVNFSFDEIDLILRVFINGKNIYKRDFLGGWSSNIYFPKGKIRIESDNLKIIDGKVLKQHDNYIEGEEELTVRLNTSNFKIYFIDDKTKWLIYAC